MSSYGISAQSIGGGGGNGAHAAPTFATSTLSLTFEIGGKGGGGNGGDVTVSNDGSIATFGMGSSAILAQSIGGGIAGDSSSVQYDTSIVKDAGFNGGAGKGGAVNVDIFADGGKAGIATAGANAPGILAMSIGSGGAFTGQGIMLSRQWDGDGASGGAVTVGVNSGAYVIARGTNSPGIFVVSAGHHEGTLSGGDVTISVGKDAIVQGGEGELGSAVTALTFGAGKIAITNNGAMTSLGGVAIRTNAITNIVNNGTVEGDVYLNGKSNFQNSGDLYTGSKFSGLLTNAGTINPGGDSSTSFTRTQFSDPVVQTAAGSYAPDIDFMNEKADTAEFKTTAELGGTVAPQLHNPVRDVEMQVAAFDTGWTDKGLKVKTPPLFTAQMEKTQSSLAIELDANFQPSGWDLMPDQSNIAQHLRSVWNTSEVAAGALFDPFVEPAARSLTHLHSTFSWRSRSRAACATETPCSLTSLTVSSLNSRLNFLLYVHKLQFRQTPYLNVHETGSKPAIAAVMQSGSPPWRALWLPPPRGYEDAELFQEYQEVRGPKPRWQLRRVRRPPRFALKAVSNRSLSGRTEGLRHGFRRPWLVDRN